MCLVRRGTGFRPSLRQTEGRGEDAAGGRRFAPRKVFPRMGRGDGGVVRTGEAVLVVARGTGEVVVHAIHMAIVADAGVRGILLARARGVYVIARAGRAGLHGPSEEEGHEQKP